MRSEGFEKLTYRRRKQLDSLYSQALLALLARVVCGVVLAAIMFDSSRTRNLLSWGGIMITVAALRYAQIRGFHARDIIDDQLYRWRYAFVATLFASGAAWGSASYFLAPTAMVTDQAIIIIFVCGFTAAVVAAFSVDRPAFPVFATPALGIPAANLALFSDSNGHALAYVLIMFSAFLLAYALRSNKATMNDFDSRFETQQLTAKLEAEKDKITVLAEQLEVLVKARTDELSRTHRNLSDQVQEKIQADENTKIQESRFLDVFDQAPIGMLVVHADSGRIVRANSAICEFLGYDTAELSGMIAEKIFCPSERIASDGGSIFERDAVTERRYLHRRGYIVWGRTSAGVMTESERGDSHFVIQIEDLSELKRARDDLSERSDSLEVAFQAAPVGMAVIDASGRIVNGNSCIRAILNLDGNIEGRSLTSILNIGDEESSSNVLARLFSRELDSIEFEHQLFGTGETSKPVIVRITRVNGHSATRLFAVVHIRDKLAAFGSTPESELTPDSTLVPLRALA